MTKVLVSLDDELLKEVDRRARELHVSRSKYLADLAERDVRDRPGPGASPRVRAALSRAKALSRGFTEGPPAEVAVRQTRDER